MHIAMTFSAPLFLQQNELGLLVQLLYWTGRERRKQMTGASGVYRLELHNKCPTIHLPVEATN